ncbi:MAG TPA: EthD family reductase [Amycolatopsis sp.]|nr:EthD family reductase [Amycolatopsis sp.]
MYRLTVVYDHPADPEKFLKYYREVHIPLAAKLPNLVAAAWGPCENPDGSKPPFFVITTLDWASKEEAFAALGSPVGKETSADVANFADPKAVRMAFSEIAQ